MLILFIMIAIGIEKKKLDFVSCVRNTKIQSEKIAQVFFFFAERNFTFCDSFGTCPW